MRQSTEDKLILAASIYAAGFLTAMFIFGG